MADSAEMTDTADYTYRTVEKKPKNNQNFCEWISSRYSVNLGLLPEGSTTAISTQIFRLRWGMPYKFP